MPRRSAARGWSRRGLLAAAAGLPAAASWPEFRGDGQSLPSSLPRTWSETEHVDWSVATEGYGQSSPVIWDQTVYLTGIDGPNKESLLLWALDLQTGRPRWTHKSEPRAAVEVTDMGSIGLAAWAPERYAEVRAASRIDGFDWEQWETARFGVSSAAVGEWLAAEWDLPQELRAVMSRDDGLDSPHQLLVAVTTAGSELATGYGLGVVSTPEAFDRVAVLTRLHLDPELASELPDTAEELLESAVV